MAIAEDILFRRKPERRTASDILFRREPKRQTAEDVLFRREIPTEPDIIPQIGISPTEKIGLDEWAKEQEAMPWRQRPEDKRLDVTPPEVAPIGLVEPEPLDIGVEWTPPPEEVILRAPIPADITPPDIKPLEDAINEQVRIAAFQVDTLIEREGIKPLKRQQVFKAITHLPTFMTFAGAGAAGTANLLGRLGIKATPYLTASITNAVGWATAEGILSWGHDKEPDEILLNMATAGVSGAVLSPAFKFIQPKIAKFIKPFLKPDEVSKAFRSVGVKKGAKWSDIMKSYRTKAAKIHPDRPGGDVKKMQELVNAFEVLKKNKAYVKVNSFLDKFRSWVRKKGMNPEEVVKDPVKLKNAIIEYTGKPMPVTPVKPTIPEPKAISRIQADVRRIEPVEPLKEVVDPVSLKDLVIKKYNLIKGISKPIQTNLTLGDLTLSKKAIEGSLQDIRDGLPTKTKEIIKVHYDTNNNAFIVIDGQHRIAELIEKGEGAKSKKIPVRIVSSGYSDYYSTPKGEFVYDLPEKPKLLIVEPLKEVERPPVKPIEPIKPPVEVKPIPKDIEPLAVEARLFDSRVQFIDRKPTKAEMLQGKHRGGEIVIFTKNVDGTKRTPGQIKDTTLHEIGHAFDTKRRGIVADPMGDAIRGFDGKLRPMADHDIYFRSGAKVQEAKNIRELFPRGVGGVTQKEIYADAYKLFRKDPKKLEEIAPVISGEITDFYTQSVKEEPIKPPVEVKPIPKELEPLAVEARKYKTAEEFVKAQERQYAGAHEAPTRSDGYAKSADNLEGIYPEDIYGIHGARYYGDGSSFDNESIGIISRMKGKPSRRITIYRAIPKTLTIKEQISELDTQYRQYQRRGRIPSRTTSFEKNPQDWANETLTEIENLEAKLLKEGDVSIEKIKINVGDWVSINRKYAAIHGRSNLKGYKILSKTVRVDEIFTDGNSIHEWGYDPLIGGTKTKSQLTDIWKQTQAKLPIEKKVVKPPEKKVVPPVEVKPPVKKRYTATVEGIKELRDKFGLEDVEVDKAKKWVDVFNRAAESKQEPTYLAKGVIEKPRVLTNEEFATLLIRRAELEDILNIATKGASEAIDAGNETERMRFSDNINRHLEELSEITTAMRFSNREAGRALNIVKLSLEKEAEQYKVAKLLQKAKIAKGKTLSTEETNKIARLAENIERYKNIEKELQKEIDNLQTELAGKDARREFIRTTRTIRRKRDVATTKNEIDNILKELQGLGLRVNEGVGMSFEAAGLISKLAIKYFQTGIKSMESITEKIQNRLPDMTKKDIWNAIGGRIHKTKKIVVSETKRQIIDLKTQARLLSRIDDISKGIINKIDSKMGVSSKEVMKLKKMLKNLKLTATRSVKEDERLLNIKKKIDTLHDNLVTGFRSPENVKVKDSEIIANAKKDLRELRSLLNTTDKINDLQSQLNTGNFKETVKIQRVIKSSDLINAQVKLTQLRREVREMIHRMKPRTARELFVDIVSLPRELMATADVSGIARQGAILSALDITNALKISIESIPAFFSQDKADAIDNAIRKSENFPTREKAGLFMASLDNIRFTDREESFLSSLGEKIPLYGKVVRASSRNMVSHLNLLRSTSFDKYLKLYPDATDEELRNWASYVNIASGRGDLKSFQKVANELSVILFSPRFTASRLQLPYEVFRYKSTPRVRKEIAKNYIKFLALVGTALWLAKMGGAEVEIDPRSSDWLKIKIGDTRIDLWGGLQQPMRVQVLALLQLAQRTKVVKLKKDINLFTAIGRFMAYKLSPSVITPIALITGKDIIGRERTLLQTTLNTITPLVANDIVETFKDNKLLGFILTPFILLGVSINTYEGSLGKKIRRLKTELKEAGIWEGQKIRTQIMKLQQEQREQKRLERMRELRK